VIAALQESWAPLRSGATAESCLVPASPGTAGTLARPLRDAGGSRQRLGGRFLVQLDEGELAGAVDGHQQVEAALLGPDLGDVDVEVADR